MKERVISAAELAKAERLGQLCAVYKVDATTIVKSSDSVRLSEAATMKFVQAHTTIPVPEVYNAYRDPETGHTRIIMQLVEGDCLEDVWDKFDESQKQSIIDQLRGFFTQMRNIKGPFVGCIDGTACEDNIFTDLSYGPYENEDQFNEGIVRALKGCRQGSWVDLVCEMVRTFKDHEIVFTHGDFAPRNILVQGTKVVAVLDWEMSGFYPEYWEYVKALWRPTWQSGWVKEKVTDQILKPYLTELAVVWHTREITW